MVADSMPAGEGRSDDRLLLDVIFVVDCSGSMTGERIGSLNWAARTVVPMMRDHAAEHPEVDLRLRVLRFATGAIWTTTQPISVAGFTWTSLAAGGESDLGAAFRLIAAVLAKPDRALDRILPPVIVLLSDGYPSDDAESGLEALLATDLGARAIRIPIAIGQDADLGLLRSFASEPGQRPLPAQDIERVVGLMRWALAEPAATKTAPSDATKPTDPTVESDENIW